MYQNNRLLPRISSTLNRIPPSITFGLAGFAVLRLITGFVIFFATRLVPVVGKILSPCTLSTNQELISWGRFGYLLAAMERWDTCHYLLIAKHGYFGNLQQTVWPPLFPMLIAAFNKIFQPPMLAALIVSNLAALASFILFYDLVKRYWGEDVARKSVLLLAVFPSAFFLVAGYTESLALAFSLACFLALHDRKWIWAGVWAALTTLTRLQGALLIVPIIIVAIKDAWQLGRRLPPKLPAILGSAVLPVIAFAGYNVYIHFGLQYPWPSQTLANVWGLPTGMPWDALIETITYLMSRLPGSPASVGYNYTSLLANLILFALSVYWLIAGRKLPLEYQVYAWLFLIIPIYQIGSTSHLRSVPRYALAVFPIFIVQALQIKKRWVLFGFVLISLAAQIQMLVSFYQWFWVA